MRKARMENDVVFVSIFINPTQFGPKEDLSTYPRSIEHDVQLLQQENVDHVFIPTDPSIMYQTNHCTYIVAEVRILQNSKTNNEKRIISWLFCCNLLFDKSNYHLFFLTCYE